MQKFDNAHMTGGTHEPAINPASELPPPQDVISADNDAADAAMIPASIAAMRSVL